MLDLLVQQTQPIKRRRTSGLNTTTLKANKRVNTQDIDSHSRQPTVRLTWEEERVSGPGNGGLPHLSFIKRKPQPLGTELKSVCEGTFGICMFMEIQKGKIRMARKKWARTYGATPVVLSVSWMECK